MRIGVLGTGQVGRTLAAKLVALGHDVVMGARTTESEKSRAAASAAGAPLATFLDAATHGELVIHCTRGDTAIVALEQARAGLAGKVLLDVSNPLDFSKGFPPSLSISNTDSLGELIQRTFPEARVVKALHTVNAAVMVEPSRVPGPHTLFVSGNDDAAKGAVMDLLRSFGWVSIIDLGDITTARGSEQLLPLWVRLYSLFGTGDFNWAVMRKPG